MFSMTIWGDRGSMPTPGPDTVLFGGNTSCLEIRVDGRLIIVDAGSGIRGLGDKLLREDIKKGPIDADIFITHTHWDHIMTATPMAPRAKTMFSCTMRRVRRALEMASATREGSSVMGTSLQTLRMPHSTSVSWMTQATYSEARASTGSSRAARIAG